ncbi:type II secretion system protein GspD [Pseudothermotoga thermarum]|uniref:Type II and III secretion system protein n=1 Tax=Pseudothermotoga thermarum DSM 5069 TaxID=688269 RepID=F7YX04_9THEM|nr:secretin [Pseudothermotoga thermarum]AEH50598.1 type II and III secretion system protein [Pseudothermotoga thermarum DSM 5069]
MKRLTIVLVCMLGILMFAQEEPLVTNIFFDTYILDALADISAQTGVPIIVDQTVSGFITAEFDNVPLEKALKMLLMPGGYVFIKVDGFYFVGSPDPKNPAFRYLADTVSFKPKYVKVDSVKNLLPAFYEPFVKFDAVNNLITISAPREIVERFKEDLERIDLPPKQIKISVLVTEVSESVVKDLGFDQIGYQFGANQQFNEDWTASLGLVSGTLSFRTDMFGTIVATIKAFEEEQKAKIKADPWIIVQENRPAKLFIGQREIILIETAAAAVTTQTVDVGVGIDISARVVNEDEIELTVAPSVSHFAQARTTTALSTKRSELSTTLRMQSGQTLVISGMTVESSSDSYVGLPLFKSIPLLRYLFGVKSEAEGKREMLIFVSAEVL